MPNNIDEKLYVVIDSNPETYKPILYATYDSKTKYNLHIVYEDQTTKDIELVQNDKDRPYKFVFKRDGKLITAVGVPTVREINECNKMCDFVNKIMDSNDLLIELDCSSEYECNKLRFYLKDVRDIIDINEPVKEPEYSLKEHTIYHMYLNKYSCDTIIPCNVVQKDDIFTTTLSLQLTKFGEYLTREQYSDFDIFAFDFDPILTVEDIQEDETVEKVKMIIPEELLDSEITLIVRYFITEIEHPIFDEFVIIPSKATTDEDNESTQNVLTRAVSTQDTQYLGDGLKPALGVGITPGYKEYRNKKSYSDSVLE